ncbi:hypothetical protein Tco_0093867, partial [Tanacetum coccineum]
MAAPIISISSDTSEESVPIVPADPIVTPEVGAVSVVSPSGVLDLVGYSPFSNSDPSEDSLPPVPDFPLVLPFLCSDDSEADGESEPAEQRPVSSSHDTLASLSEFPLAPVVAPPRIHRRSATLIRPGEAIPFGRPYRTHPNGSRKLLTPRTEIQKMETKLWNLTVKNNDLATYTQIFQELTMMRTKMVPEEEDRVEKFIGGLPDNILGNVIAAEPTRLQDVIRIANNLMDQKL